MRIAGRTRWAFLLTTVGLTATAALGFPSAAVAAGSPLVPSVSVRPLHPAPHSPNDGQWFVTRLAAGQSSTQLALLTNVTGVPAVVHLYARDLAFEANGTPVIVSRTVPSGVGEWTQVDPASVVVPAYGTRVVAVRVAVPAGAVPGDHIGVLVAQSAPQLVNGERVIERIATRIYVTVPGVATRGMAIIGFTHAVHSSLWPTSVSVVATLRNTGQIALAPAVRIDGRPASGSTDLLTQSVETYTTTVHVAWWGAHLRLRVTASARGVPTRSRSVSLWVINWVVIAMVLVGLVGLSVTGVSAVSKIRRRRAERRALHARISELEAQLPTAAGVGSSGADQRQA